MSTRSLFVLVSAAVLLAACGPGPTISGGDAAVVPSFDAAPAGYGHTLGASDEMDGEQATAQSDSTGRGGFTIGSGS